ncbi:hypothetical protein ACFPN7_26570 [Amycolatopsis halotolerans]|uniref:hypothetical protein n=1 Tax=Amycolatopsis halotolerans TaxID=330083 RepID=UPI00360A1494
MPDFWPAPAPHGVSPMWLAASLQSEPRRADDQAVCVTATILPALARRACTSVERSRR